MRIDNFGEVLFGRVGGLLGEFAGVDVVGGGHIVRKLLSYYLSALLLNCNGNDHQRYFLAWLSVMWRALLALPLWFFGWNL